MTITSLLQIAELLPIIILGDYIIIPLLPIITIITYYNIVETGQLADRSQVSRSQLSPPLTTPRARRLGYQLR